MAGEEVVQVGLADPDKSTDLDPPKAALGPPAMNRGAAPSSLLLHFGQREPLVPGRFVNVPVHKCRLLFFCSVADDVYRRPFRGRGFRPCYSLLGLLSGQRHSRKIGNLC